MNILCGSQWDNPKTAAVGYLLEGYSAIPLTGKLPSLGWKVFQQRCAPIVDIHWWEQSGKLNNVGIVCGAVSQNLVVIDLDGQAAVDLWKAQFAELTTQTFSVRTGSGLHIYFHVDTLPNNRKVTLPGEHSEIAILSSGRYVVAVPSIHPTTQKRYSIYVRKPVLRIDGLWAIEDWLKTLETPQTASFEPLPAIEEKRPSIGKNSTAVLYDRHGQPVRNPAAYARIALSDETSRIRRAMSGSRNDSLYAGAQRMGQFINKGLLTQAEVVQALLGAAHQWADHDQSERQLLATIASGLSSQAGKDTR